MQAYFQNSEQLPTRLWLHADAQGASGMLLQKLPGASSLPAADAALIEDSWRRVQLIADTLTPEELRSLADAEILHRLFNEDDLRLFEPSPVYFRCRCSRERVAGMLQGLGEVETRSVIAERGKVEVHCDFCNRALYSTRWMSSSCSRHRRPPTAVVARPRASTDIKATLRD